MSSPDLTRTSVPKRSPNRLREFVLFGLGGPVLALFGGFIMAGGGASEAMVPVYILGIIAGVVITFGYAAYSLALGILWLISKVR